MEANRHKQTNDIGITRPFRSPVSNLVLTSCKQSLMSDFADSWRERRRMIIRVTTSCFWREHTA